VPAVLRAPDQVSAPALCLIGCAAPPVLRFRDVITAARAEGWQVCPILTPSAARWLSGELPELEQLAGSPLYIEYARPGDGGHPPRPQAVLVTPATANTVNKCAAGISDTLALGTMNDAIGRGVPVVLVTAVGADGAHPAFRRSAALLRETGVELIETPPGREQDGGPAASRPPFPWRDGLLALAPSRDRPGSHQPQHAT
jgi:hypothetical protein